MLIKRKNKLTRSLFLKTTSDLVWLAWSEAAQRPHFLPKMRGSMIMFEVHECADIKQGNCIEIYNSLHQR